MERDILGGGAGLGTEPKASILLTVANLQPSNIFSF